MDFPVFVPGPTQVKEKGCSVRSCQGLSCEAFFRLSPGLVKTILPDQFPNEPPGKGFGNGDEEVDGGPVKVGAVRTLLVNPNPDPCDPGAARTSEAPCQGVGFFHVGQFIPLGFKGMGKFLQSLVPRFFLCVLERFPLFGMAGIIGGLSGAFRRMAHKDWTCYRGLGKKKGRGLPFEGGAPSEQGQEKRGKEEDAGWKGRCSEKGRQR